MDKRGDDNTKLFHGAIRERKLRNTVYGINDVNGRWVDTGEGVKEAFLSYYKGLLGASRSTRGPFYDDVIARGAVLTEDQQGMMLRPFIVNNVKMVLFSIPDDKSPGLDGFGAGFYKDSWSVIGEDVSRAIWISLSQGGYLEKLMQLSLH